MTVLVLYERAITECTGGAPGDWGAREGAGLMFLSQVSEWKDTPAPGDCGAGLALRTYTPLRNRQTETNQGSSCHHHHHRHLTKTRDITHHPSPVTTIIHPSVLFYLTLRSSRYQLAWRCSVHEWYLLNLMLISVYMGNPGFGKFRVATGRFCHA